MKYCGMICNYQNAIDDCVMIDQSPAGVTHVAASMYNSHVHDCPKGRLQMQGVL